MSKLKQHNVTFLAENISFRIMLMVHCLSHSASHHLFLHSVLQYFSERVGSQHYIRCYFNIPVFNMCLCFDRMSFVYSKYLHYIWQTVTDWYFNIQQWCYTQALWGAPNYIKCRFLHNFALHFFRYLNSSVELAFIVFGHLMWLNQLTWTFRSAVWPDGSLILALMSWAMPRLPQEKFDGYISVIICFIPIFHFLPHEFN